LSSRYRETVFQRFVKISTKIRTKAIEAGGSGQGETPEVPKAPDQKQPDQAALEKRERRRASQRKYYQQNRERLLEQARQRYHQDPEPARERARKQTLKWREQNRERVLERAAEKPSRTRREYQREYYLKNRERIRERKREYNRRKKEAKMGGGETTIFPDPAATPPVPESPSLASPT
jgi:hypothetical protein